MNIVKITQIVCLLSIIFCIRHIGVEHNVPYIAACSKVAQVMAVVMVVVRGIADKREDTDWTPREMVTRMPFATNEDLPSQPVEKDKAVHLISYHNQRNR